MEESDGSPRDQNGLESIVIVEEEEEVILVM